VRGDALQNFGYPPTIPAGIPSELLTRRPDIAEAEDQLIALNARVTQARALFFPQISLTGSYGSQSDALATFLTAPAQIWQYGVSAVQMIFDAGKLQYQLEAVAEMRDQALFNYRQVILTALQQVNDALVQIEMNNKLVAEHKTQVKVLELYVSLATLRYLEGEVDYLNVLDAQRSLFDAQLNYIQAQADNLNAVVSLYSALGGGWVDDADAFAITRDPTLTSPDADDTSHECP
jgi:multidrug efflux system outer membrane protein